MTENFQLIVSSQEAHQRLDKFLVDMLPHFSRSRLQALIEEGHVHIVPERRVTASLKLKEGETINVTVPPLHDPIPQPNEIALDIVYEDEHLLVINKSAGMVVHPAPGHSENTLVNALLAHCGDSLSGIGGVRRPGIVHRLDKDTSGLMVVAKHDLAHQGLTTQFSDRSLSRLYLALVWGLPSPTHGTISTLIGRHPRYRQKMAVVHRLGREAITNYHMRQHFEWGTDITTSLSLIECKLMTGRTHQIRVHLHHIGHPLVGDPLYGHPPKKAAKICPEEVLSFPRQALHAFQLQFIHPVTNESLVFEESLPTDIETLLKCLIR